MNEPAGRQSDSPTNNSGKTRQDDASGRAGRSRRRSRGRRSGEQKNRQATPQAPRQEQGAQDVGRQQGRRRGNRRRPAPPPEHTPTHVLRNDAVQKAPIQPMRLRPILEDDTSEPEFGCPMLTRTRLGIPFRGGQHVPRCAMGWAIHDEDEVLFCMHTASRNECWKEHPELLDKLVEKLRPQIEAELREREEGSAAD